MNHFLDRLAAMRPPRSIPSEGLGPLGWFGIACLALLLLAAVL